MENDIFKASSITYYWAAKFFPKNIRRDVVDLYSFLRLADDYVDSIPTDKDGFYHLRRLWLEAYKNPEFSTQKLTNDSPNECAVKNIVRLVREKGIKKQWVEDFLDAMQSDLSVRGRTSHKYGTLHGSLDYTYGSAEVVGLMMCKVMDLPDEAHDAARLQGRAMQWLNFIRDIAEDNTLGRQYFPMEDLRRFNLKDLSREAATAHPKEYKNFIHFQIDRYKGWQREAEVGYKYIPRRSLIPIKTAAEMYLWTADQIAKDPLIVFQEKVKPGKLRVLTRGLSGMLR